MWRVAQSDDRVREADQDSESFRVVGKTMLGRLTACRRTQEMDQRLLGCLPDHALIWQQIPRQELTQVYIVPAVWNGRLLWFMMPWVRGKACAVHLLLKLQAMLKAQPCAWQRQLTELVDRAT
mmetsp:Transcript_49038/g.114469  ORF Transcript_49038/g.114469 Transcript_49038/m.114469 type:complete len:123 (+) Transcript_49038:38-406(+)